MTFNDFIGAIIGTFIVAYFFLALFNGLNKLFQDFFGDEYQIKINFKQRS